MPWRAEGSPAACDPTVPWGCRNAGPQHSTVVPVYSADVVAVCGSSEDARFLDGLARAPSQALGEASGCPGSPGQASTEREPLATRMNSGGRPTYLCSWGAGEESRNALLGTQPPGFTLLLEKK